MAYPREIEVRYKMPEIGSDIIGQPSHLRVSWARLKKQRREKRGRREWLALLLIATKQSPALMR